MDTVCELQATGLSKRKRIHRLPVGDGFPSEPKADVKTEPLGIEKDHLGTPRLPRHWIEI